MSDQTTRPPLPPPPTSVHAQRRDPGGPRRAASDRVALRSDATEIIGWTLNVSRGGARLVVEDPLAVGQLWDLWVSEAAASRPVRVVWVRNEAGGQIVGIQFMDSEGTIPPFEDDVEGS